MGNIEEEMARDFTMTYDGPALRSGRMPVRDLAPALLAMGTLFQEAQAVLAPTEPPPNLELRGTEHASFDALLHLAQPDVVTILTGPKAQAAANLLALIGGVRGVFWLIKQTRGKEEVGPRQQTGGETTLFLNDEASITVENLVVNLYDRPTVRKAASEVVHPLRHEGVDVFRLDTSHDDPVEVRSEEIDAFTVPEGEPYSDQVIDAALIPITFSTVPNYIWRLRMGEQMIRARVADEGFFEKIKRHEVGFLEGDVLYSRLRMRQWPPTFGKPIEWTILEVVRQEHVGGIPIPLFPPDQEEGDEGS